MDEKFFELQRLGLMRDWNRNQYLYDSERRVDQRHIFVAGRWTSWTSWLRRDMVNPFSMTNADIWMNNEITDVEWPGEALRPLMDD